MSSENRLLVGIVLFFALCVSATGQQPTTQPMTQPMTQPITQEQARHISNIKKKLNHYGTGTKLDVLLMDGSHHVGTLSQLGSDSFVLADQSNTKPDSMDYLDIQRVQPTRRDYVAQQFGKAAQDAPKVVVIALSAVAVIAFLVLAVK